MYESFYRLKEKPFSLLPDPDYLYLSGKHGTALALLEYSLLNQTGFCVISGETGAGKTTLIRRVLAECGGNVSVGLISNTHRAFGELLGWICMAFGLEYQGKTKPQLYEGFIQFLIDQYAKSRQTVLVIDEAQNMSPETLEELRMLSNVNADKDQVLQMILVGQPGLQETLRRPGLEQFAQRIAVDYHLGPLSREETGDYIRHRLVVAGGRPDVFDDEACDVVFQYSRGTPRLINLLCDSVLVYGYAQHRSTVDASIVRNVMRDREVHDTLPHFASGATDARPLVAAADIAHVHDPQHVVVAADNGARLSAQAAIEPLADQTKGEPPEEEQQFLHRSVAAAGGVPALVQPTLTGSADDGVEPPRAVINKLVTMETWSRNSIRVGARYRAGRTVGTQESQSGASFPSDGTLVAAPAVQPVHGAGKDDKLQATAVETVPLDDRTVIDLDKGVGMANHNLMSDARERRPRVFWGAAAVLGFISGLLVAAILIGAVYLRLGPAAPPADSALPPDAASVPLTAPPPAAGASVITPPPALHAAEDSADKARLLEIRSERDAALAEARALERERDAALAVAKARERATKAELRAARAEEQERAAARGHSVAARVKHDAEPVASEARPKQATQPVPAAPAASEAVNAAVVAPAAPAAAPKATKDSAPLKFSANPCKGPSAKFLSTCKE